MPFYGESPLQIQFTDKSTDATSWLWNFGDGSTSTSQNPTNTYSSDGTYVVTLTVITAKGAIRTQDTVVVAATPSPSGQVNSPVVYIAAPQMMMRFSDDGGWTWGVERMGSAGKTGQYGTRVHWHRLGTARRRVFEVSVTDPVPWRITNAYVDVEVGQH